MAKKRKQAAEVEGGGDINLEGAESEPLEELPPAGEAAKKVGEAVTSEEEDLTAELETCRQEAARNWDHYLRAKADLENYRRRAQREKEDLARFSNENILREILPVIDNLERAVEHASREEGGSGGLLEGVEMTLAQFRRALEKFGVTPVLSLGEPFDPARHEAMGQTVSADLPPNSVSQELQKGYLLHDRLLRPALVMVSKAPAEE